MPSDAKRFLQPSVLAAIGDLELRARNVVEGFVSGMHRSPYHGFSVEFAQHKEYVAGDDIRHLDWRVYGRTDRFYIKQFEEETNLRTHILLDCSASMRYPEQDAAAGRMSKFEYGATLAASLGYLLTRQQDAVGLLLFDNGIRDEVPPSSSQAHLKAIIARIEAARLDSPTELDALFSQLAGKLYRRSLVVVISDLLADPEEVIPGLERIRSANHEVVVMHVLDHDEREFPFQDNTLFEGLEAPAPQLMVDPQSLRTGYLDALNRFVARLRAACTNSRIDYVGLTTRQPLDIALRSYLAARTHMIKART
ncbi:MAG: DUF58 domain-containing protein [Phycisphaerae bacterium]